MDTTEMGQAAAPEMDTEQPQEADSGSMETPPADDSERVTLSQGLAREIHAREVHIVQGAAASIEADDVSIVQGAVGLLRAEDVSVSLGGAGLIAADRVRLAQGGAQTVLAREVSVEQGGAGLVLARDVNIQPQTFVGFLVAQTVTGDVRTLFDWRGAVAFGAVFALVTSILRAARRR
jgi:hypothetical protein